MQIYDGGKQNREILENISKKVVTRNELFIFQIGSREALGT